uniref:PPM-type phosphatase domain-containing protein n=1 Tax=Salix viminalis TaxID=40686 RepID=A0A6N2N6F7_SALVM
MAVVQANNLLEDQSQIESGPLSTLDSGLTARSWEYMMVMVGRRHHVMSMIILFQHLKSWDSCFLSDDGLNLAGFTSEQQSMSCRCDSESIQATEEGFFLCHKQCYKATNCCCWVLLSGGCDLGVILYIANLGDSRAVLGSLSTATGEVLAIQLSSEHNVAIESVRQEMHSLHPDDSRIVVLKHNISRSIGDVYLKKPEFNREPLYTKFRLREPFKRPILSSEPSISVHELQPHDQFLVFASDGLWEHLSNEEAVDIVQNHPRSGIARRLIKAALQEAAKKREMRYSDLKKIDRGVRRHFHDDITVAVVFLDANLISFSRNGWVVV